VGSGHYEVILCHCRTQAEANTLQADAQRLGYTAVIQVIHPTDIEVEIVNGLQTQAEAARFCAQEQPKLAKGNLHCHAEQEMHGIPSGWRNGHGPGQPPPTTGHPHPQPPPGPPAGNGHHHHNGNGNGNSKDNPPSKHHRHQGGHHSNGGSGGLSWWGGYF
jgi:hypothetical protein